jgi:acyl-CoA dehydrogenase
MDFLDAPPLPFYFSPDHEQFRASVRDFISREITPPRERVGRGRDLSALALCARGRARHPGLGYPEEYGGTPADLFYQLVVAEEFARCGSGGVQASMNSHGIALPPILAAAARR